MASGVSTNELMPRATLFKSTYTSISPGVRRLTKLDAPRSVTSTWLRLSTTSKSVGRLRSSMGTVRRTSDFCSPTTRNHTITANTNDTILSVRFSKMFIANLGNHCVCVNPHLIIRGVRRLLHFEQTGFFRFGVCCGHFAQQILQGLL